MDNLVIRLNLKSMFILGLHSSLFLTNERSIGAMVLQIISIFLHYICKRQYVMFYLLQQDKLRIYLTKSK